MPYLYVLIPTLDTPRILSTWVIISDHIVGVICSSVDLNTMYTVSDIKCPHILWKRLWEIHGDPHISPYPEDPATDCLIPLADAYSIPFDDDTLEELAYITDLVYSDGSKTCIHVPTLHIKTTSSPVVLN